MVRCAACVPSIRSRSRARPFHSPQSCSTVDLPGCCRRPGVEAPATGAAFLDQGPPAPFQSIAIGEQRNACPHVPVRPDQPQRVGAQEPPKIVSQSRIMWTGDGRGPVGGVLASPLIRRVRKQENLIRCDEEGQRRGIGGSGSGAGQRGIGGGELPVADIQLPAAKHIRKTQSDRFGGRDRRRAHRPPGDRQRREHEQAGDQRREEPLHEYRGRCPVPVGSLLTPIRSCRAAST